MYNPKLVDISDVTLPEELFALTEKNAENVQNIIYGLWADFLCTVI